LKCNNKQVITTPEKNVLNKKLKIKKYYFSLRKIKINKESLTKKNKSIKDSYIEKKHQTYLKRIFIFLF
jgi:hypothetical protein